MKIGIPKEIYEGERCVALVPKMAAQLIKDDKQVLIEKNAGVNAFFPDFMYEQAGAIIVPDAQSLYAEADVIMKVKPPQMNASTKRHEVEMMKSGTVYIGFLAQALNRDIIHQMMKKDITCFAMDLIPRIARSQSMDALSSMGSISGYRAVLIAASHIGKFFPLMMTAAGTIPPARVLVLGAGVAGLQSIATARRLGARVEAFDTRPAVREQVESLGAKFIEMELVKDAETSGGYAQEMSKEYIKKELEIIGNRIEQNDVVITTALIFGKKAPILITEEMVKRMEHGSIIVDLAAERGGNCELTEPGKSVTKHGVIICGIMDLPSTLPIDASQMYSKNVTNLFKHIYNTKDGAYDFKDEITASTCIIHNGKILSKLVEKAFQKGEQKSD